MILVVVAKLGSLKGASWLRGAWAISSNFNFSFMNSEWARSEKLALYALCVAIIGVLVAVFIPELRNRLGLNPERVAISPSNPAIDASTPNAPPASTDARKEKSEKAIEIKTVTVSPEKDVN